MFYGGEVAPGMVAAAGRGYVMAGQVWISWLLAMILSLTGSVGPVTAPGLWSGPAPYGTSWDAPEPDLVPKPGIRPADSAPSGGCGIRANSFTPETLFAMADGTYRRIDQVQVGDQVLSEEPTTGEESTQAVTATVSSQRVRDVVDITLTDGTQITSTPEHPFWDATLNQWVNAADLTPGHRLDTATPGGTATIAAISQRRALLTAHNLAICHTHTYRITTHALLVHNTGPKGPGGKGCDVAAKAEVGGGGQVFTHYTDADGIAGITGVGPLNVGDSVGVGSLKFGQGSNNFLARAPGDNFVTDLGVDATPRQLEGIGVFGTRQQYAIQFSQEAALNSAVRPVMVRDHIFTIPGGSCITGACTVTRVL